MQIVGALLMLLGVAVAGVAFGLETGVSTPAIYGAESAQVANLSLMQSQMMVLLVGLASFVAGAVLYGAGGVVERLAISQSGYEEGQPPRSRALRITVAVVSAIVAILALLFATGFWQVSKAPDDTLPDVNFTEEGGRPEFDVEPTP